ncbi:hypothetical protein [Paraburkholderia dilworthii]|nr:hypothetical protein [Paraburkholderia dilworthii]
MPTTDLGDATQRLGSGEGGVLTEVTLRQIGYALRASSIEVRRL